MESPCKLLFKLFFTILLIVGMLDLQLHQSSAFLSDTESHPPPSSGTYEYSPPGTFLPNSASFPAAGDSYVDPVFNERVTRLTDVYSAARRHVSYSAKLVINADSTKMIVEGNGDFHIYDLSGNLLRSNPNGFAPNLEDWSWHPVDADKLLFFDGRYLREYSYASNSASIVKNFGSGQWNGGTAEFTDQTGRYYCGLVSGSLRFYDRTQDTFYGNQPSIGSNDFIIIAPDGSGVLVVGGGSKADTTWYPVDHTAQNFKTGADIKATCNATPHGDLITDSDGSTHFICDGNPITKIAGQSVPNIGVIYKIPVEDPSNWSSVLAKDWMDGHISCNINGTNRDWFCFNSENADDTGDPTPWSPWQAYKAEILLVNVKTGDLRRLAHHRSRNPLSDYSRQPKACLSIDGSLVIFNSNMGSASGNYVDAYTVTTGFAPGPPAAPQNLRIIKIE